MCSFQVQAAETLQIKDGVYIGHIDVSGMTASQASETINSYVDSLMETTITLNGVEGKTISVTVAEMGLYWENTEVVEEAEALGQKGNVITRYKAQKDLEYNNEIYDLVLNFDKSSITTFIENNEAIFNQEAINVSLVKSSGAFSVKSGQTGYSVDVESSANTVYEYLMTEWNHEAATIDLVIVEDTPLGSAEELANVTDIIGSFTTSYTTSSSARIGNISNGCSLINGVTLYPGETFSMFEYILPFTEANGYYMAGSYLSGMVVDSIGGGICQVSTTLYNAVLAAELQIDERYNHSMTVSYVVKSADAAIAESAGKDFKFTNTTDYPIYIEGITTEEKQITFNIYGKETRAANRTIGFESEITEVISPTTESIVQSTAYPLGYVSIQSAYTGYKAKYWKIIYIDGVETERVQINSSNYSMVPRTATVGISTQNVEAYNQLQAAIATGSIDQTKAVADAWAATVAAETAAILGEEAAEAIPQSETVEPEV